MIAPNIIERNPKAFIIGGLVTVLIIIGLIFWAFSGNRTDKERKLDANIGVSNGVNAVVTNLVTNQTAVVNQAANNSQVAVNNLGMSVNKDSSSFNGVNATDQFCRDFCKDSSCVEWRKTHPCN